MPFTDEELRLLELSDKAEHDNTGNVYKSLGFTRWAEVEDEAVRLYNSGHTRVDIARILGVGLSTVERKFANMDLEFRENRGRRIGYPPSWVDEWVSLRKKGLSCRVIGDMYSINPSTIQKKTKGIR